LVRLIAIELILPVACAWAKRHESAILKTGVALSPAQIATAKKMGILYPERVRLRAVPQVPPVNWLLRRVGQKLGIASGQTIGMTLRYGIFIRDGHWGDRRLLVHELAHVAQYERMGGFHGFLKQYLAECINLGYPFGELELEAKRAEAANFD
jgi:hypothetical protein